MAICCTAARATKRVSGAGCSSVPSSRAICLTSPMQSSRFPIGCPQQFAIYWVKTVKSAKTTDRQCRTRAASLRIIRIQQQPEIRQHSGIQPAGAAADAVAMVAVVLFEDVVDPLARQSARQLPGGQDNVGELVVPAGVEAQAA